MKITRLRTNHFENPIGYEIHPLCFSWTVENAEGQKTEAARVKIFRDPGLSQMLWDSGLRQDADSACFRADFEPGERTRYYWQVEVTDDAGETGVSAPAFFETAPAQIHGKWIVAPFSKDIHSIFRKEWNIPAEGKAVERARLYICGMGLYEAYINDRKVGEEFLAPFYNDYNQWLQFQSYDVTELLQSGSNELGVMLGNGWYKGRFGFIDRLDRLYGDTQALLCELEITWEDGSRTSVSSDESFLCHSSPILSSSIYDGEVYDANLASAEFCRLPRVEKKQGETAAEGTAADAEGWQPAREADASIQAWSKKLSPRYSLPLTAHERLKPAQMIHTPAGETVIDFGQELTGSFTFRCKEPKGAKIHLQAGEILQKDVFYNENLRTAKEEYTYISDGVERQVRPYFTFYGYRYLKVEGMQDLESADFTAVVLHSEMERTGTIETSNEKVNRLFLNALWGQKGNFVDVPTDCPQRDERMGWTGDAQVFAATASFNMYTPAFYAKFLHDMLGEQKQLGGAVPHVVPDILDQINTILLDPRRVEELGLATKQEENGSGISHVQKKEEEQSEDKEAELASGKKPQNAEDAEDAEQKEEKPEKEKAAGSCAWGDAATVIPWTSYLFYGDKALLEKEYPNMKLWTDYIHRIDEEKCGGGRLWNHGFHFADWLALDNFHEGSCLGGTDPYFIASAYYLYSAELTAKAAAALNKGEDALYYARLAEEVRTAMRKEYFTETGRIAIDTQTAMVVALKFDIVPPKAKNRLIQALQKKLEEEKIHLTTGFVGTPYLCPVLTQNGLAEYAYTLLLNEDFPSWLYEVNMGATTIWERWNSVLPDGSISDTGMNSLNHYSYGSIVEWMYRFMCGINPDEKAAGFRKFTLKPYPDPRFDHARASYQSVYGRIESSWARTEKGWEFAVVVPFDTEAEFLLDDSVLKGTQGRIIVTGKNCAAAEAVQEALQSAHSAQLLPGKYRITVE